MYSCRPSVRLSVPSIDSGRDMQLVCCLSATDRCLLAPERGLRPASTTWPEEDRRRLRGAVLKKKWGTPETRLRQRFLNSLGLQTCCTEIILHCVSVSNQFQQWTNFCTNFSPKSGGEWGTRPPVEKVGTPSPRVPAPLHPCCGLQCKQSRRNARVQNYAT